MQNTQEGLEKGQPAKKLGTFAGVFTPSILTILGIILFMRLGYVVGAAGLWQALLILFIANSISVLTSISLSAIATNLTVRGGGDYYLISRTLGLEFGGALGLVLFLAQAVSIGFYCMGFGEVVAGLFGASHVAAQLIALLAISGLFILAWKGADWATRFQYVVMVILGLALLSFFVGGLQSWNSHLLNQNWTPAADSPGFWVLFAVFFPAVTGFTQGVSMSGDLEEPGKSLPLGTFLAVGVSILVYFAAAFIFAGNLPQEALTVDYLAMNRVAFISLLISVGVFAATLSSAMASFLGAPRILQSLASDKIFPFLNFFAKGAGPQNNPQRAVLLAGVIAVATVALGDLNLIAGVVAMFFLISYGLLNYATYFEARAASPSFRPRFKWFNQHASLAGALVCLAAMLAIDWKSGALAVAVLFILYQYLQHTVPQSRWADSRRSYHLQQVRENLLKISREPEHPRDWRPQILAYSDSRERRKRLLMFSNWLVGKSGLTTLVRVVEGRGAQRSLKKHEAENELYKDIVDSGVPAFPLVVAATTFEIGNPLLLQAFGFGPLKANTLLLNFHSSYSQQFFSEQRNNFGRNLRAALRLGYNLVVLDGQDDEWSHIDALAAESRRVDVWYQSGNSGSLMLLLGHLLTRTEYWQQAQLRVVTPVQNDDREATQETLKKELELARIEAVIDVADDCRAATVVQNSADASLVLLPLHLKGGQIVDSEGGMVERLLQQLPLVALVVAAQEIDLDAEPEEGVAGLLAEAEDALTAARSRLQKADKEVQEQNQLIEASLEKMLAASEESDNQTLANIHAELHQLRSQLDKMTRHSAKAEVKVEHEKLRVERLREEHRLGASSPEGKMD
ncbi:transporter, cation-chloride cotransporter (CCC) family [Malonomonas rubra DSM 5091]|uniref:Transporter, cation-chloride cotransporter (CCC) family n=1 Tax=Malonomonas rubra DSM 5091 TaxID=1122189 RepID=A0A1M6KQA1_MALRU|nr:amino acid permease [Malonomonas rubra]SHJ61158.1 transporter, cation-chloride cotransporter (CCC) family [Malonomonas rubra DSM 5091]